MDETTYINLITAQLRATAISASAVLGREHAVVTALTQALATIDGAPIAAVEAVDLPPVPQGFATREEYEAFLATQFAADLADANAEREDGEDEVTAADVAVQIKDVVGVVPDADGNLREVGNLDEAVEFANGLVEAAETRYVEDEDGNVEQVRERIETDNVITVTYTRVGAENLTEDNVRTILDHPISAPLKHLGNIQLIGINDGDTGNVKSAVFALIEDGKIDLRAIALGAVRYRGEHIFPGIGRVQAVGSVNFA